MTDADASENRMKKKEAAKRPQTDEDARFAVTLIENRRCYPEMNTV